MTRADHQDDSRSDRIRAASDLHEREGSAHEAHGERDGHEAVRRRGGGRTTLTLACMICGVAITAAALWGVGPGGLLDGKPAAAPWAGSLLNFKGHSLRSNIVIFLVAAAVVWAAGTRLSVYADVIAERTGMGRAFVGLLLLAAATSLPEIATTITAALPPVSDARLLVSNLLGGIAMQTAILAVVDLLLVRHGALTYFSPRPVLMIQGVLLVALLSVAMLGIAIGTPKWLSVVGAGPWGAAMFVLFLLMLWTTHSESQHPRWRPSNPPKEVDGTDLTQRELHRFEGVSNRRLYMSFAVGSLVILVAGFVVTRVAHAITEQTGLGSALVGAILLALATSLPELSTTAKAVRLGAYGMAFGNIFGSNAFDASLLFLGDVLYRGRPILDVADRSAVFLAALGILVTCVYLWGLLERKDKTIFGMGIDSGIVLVLYIGGIAVLYSMT